MIGYYVHHHGRGHLHRALALAGHLALPGTDGEPAEALTVLSSLPRPEGYGGAWVELPLDVADDDPPPSDPTAGGVLHWAPLHQPGLRRRAALVSAWLDAEQPRLVVVDVSQEVALLVRLHGVPVVSVVQPGHRADGPHVTGLRAATALCAFWPPAATGMLSGLPDDLVGAVRPLGALSRYAPATGSGTDHGTGTAAAPSGRRHLVVIGGSGGDAWDGDDVATLSAACPAWRVTVVGPGGTWVEDPWALLLDADVVVVQAGQNAVAEVAAAGVPAVVVPGARPFDEQDHTAAVLDAGPWPAVALTRLAHDDWPGLLDRVAALDGTRWAAWCDGRAAERFAEVVREVAA